LKSLPFAFGVRMNAQIDAAWRESVEAEVNRRLAERERTIDIQQANTSQRQNRADVVDSLMLISDVNG